MATSGKRLSDRDRDRIRKMREQGVSVRNTAKAMLVSSGTVNKICKNPLAK